MIHNHKCKKNIMVFNFSMINLSNMLIMWICRYSKVVNIACKYCDDNRYEMAPETMMFFFFLLQKLWIF